MLVASFCHILAAVGVGPIFTLPLLAGSPAALRTVLVALRFGAGATLVTGALLWADLGRGHPPWLVLSAALYLAVIVTIAAVLEPAAVKLDGQPRLRHRVRAAGIAASALTCAIVGLMVLRPGAS